MSAEQVEVPMASMNEKKTPKQPVPGPNTGAGGIFVSLGLLGVSVAVAAVVIFQVDKLSNEIKTHLVKGTGKSVATKFGVKKKIRPHSVEYIADEVPLPKDCHDIQTQGQANSGIYTVYPSNMKKGISVYCEMTQDGGGWLVFQQRQDGSVPFNTDWNAYRFGFGDFNTEFWLGNEFLHHITKQGMYELRIELLDFDGEEKYAKYRIFGIAGSESSYQLTVGGYTGDAGDSFSSHDGIKFSTWDRDNDLAEGHCAAVFKGGWWYANCLTACLNGLYHGGEHESKADGINWLDWRGFNYSLKKTRMMIRPL